MMQKFSSKIDPWIHLVILGVFGFAVVSLLHGYRAEPESGGATKAGIVFSGIVIIFIGLLVRTTNYVFNGTTLTVWYGPVSWKIEVDTIRRVKSTRTFASAPAWSMDRLEIDYDGGHSLVISPADKRGFLAALVARAPQTTFENLDEYEDVRHTRV